MADVDLEAGLKKLKQHLKHIKALLSWEELKRSEAKPDQPPAFTLNDLTKTDLRNEYSSFLSISVRLHSILNDNTIKMLKAKRHKIKAALINIERQFNRLNLHQRFLPC